MGMGERSSLVLLCWSCWLLREFAVVEIDDLIVSADLI